MNDEPERAVTQAEAVEARPDPGHAEPGADPPESAGRASEASGDATAEEATGTAATSAPRAFSPCSSHGRTR